MCILRRWFCGFKVHYLVLLPLNIWKSGCVLPSGFEIVLCALSCFCHHLTEEERVRCLAVVVFMSCVRACVRA